MREIGVVNWFIESKGYGFVNRQAGPDVFLHVYDCQNPEQLTKGASVEFEVVSTSKGLRAVRAVVL